MLSILVHYLDKQTFLMYNMSINKHEMSIPMNERQEIITEYLKKHRTASVGALAKLLFVSEATVRRDLIEIEKSGQIRRTHGGAVLSYGAEEVSLFVRMNENRGAKEEAVRRALPYVPKDFKTVFLDSSSTALLLVQRLSLKGKTVVTNNLQSALLLSKIDGVDIVIPGGNLYSSSYSVKGAWTNSLLREFRFDLMISSCAAIVDGGTYESAMDQREIKRIAHERSAFHILLADQSKINGQGSYFVAPLAEYEIVAIGGEGERNEEALRGAHTV